MKHAIPVTLAIALLAGTTVHAQTTNQPASPQPSSQSTPAAVSSSANPRTTAAPVAGANSFTEGEARSRIEAKGFGNVTGLQKDNQGIWRATAMKDGKSQNVSLDYKGNIVSN